MSECLALLALHSFMEALCNASVVAFAPNVEWWLFWFPLHSVLRFHHYRCFSFHCQCRTLRSFRLRALIALQWITLLWRGEQFTQFFNELSIETAVASGTDNFELTCWNQCWIATLPEKKMVDHWSLSLSLALSFFLPAWWLSLPVGTAGEAKLYRNLLHSYTFVHTFLL